MKSTKFKYSSALLLALLATSVAGVSAVGAETVGSTNTTGQVGFVAGSALPPQDPNDNNGNNTINPQTPNVPATAGNTPNKTPITGTGANQGLSLDFAPNLNFGIHKLSNVQQVYPAYALVLQKGDVTSVEKQLPNATDGTAQNALPPFIQVTDLRGNDIGSDSGWTVQVSSPVFKSSTAKKTPLTGAYITFGASSENTVTNATGASNKANSAVNSSKVALSTPDTAYNIFSSGISDKTSVGTYTNTLSFGKAGTEGNYNISDFVNTSDTSLAKTVTLKDGKVSQVANAGSTSLVVDSNLAVGADLTGASKVVDGDNSSGLLTNDITMTVPAGVATASSYTGTLTWTLNDVPTA